MALVVKDSLEGEDSHLICVNRNQMLGEYFMAELDNSIEKEKLKLRVATTIMKDFEVVYKVLKYIKDKLGDISASAVLQNREYVFGTLGTFIDRDWDTE